MVMIRPTITPGYHHDDNGESLFFSSYFPFSLIYKILVDDWLVAAYPQLIQLTPSTLESK